MSFFEEWPDVSSPALYDAETRHWWSYGGLREEAARWAGAFRSRSKPLIFCFARNDTASVAAYLGAIEAGAAVALLPESSPAEFQARLLAAYEPDFIFDASGSVNYTAAEFRAAYHPVPQRAGLWKRVTGDGVAPHPDLALLLSTSGSTGSPKFVRLSLASVRANAHSIARALGIGPAGRAIASLPIHYSYGLSVLNSYLIRGATVALTNEGLMSPDFWRLARELACDSLAGVPYSYQILARLDLDKLNAPRLKTLTQAGGKLSPEMIRKFHEIMARRGGRFFTMYGQTEATARIAVLPPEFLPRKAGSVGFAVPGGSIAIEAGEIVYSGPNVMMGYALRRDDLALGDVQGGRLRTGDLGYLDSDGCLYVTGRIKREAKLFGLRLNLDEVESMVRAYGPAAVAGASDRLWIYCEFEESLFGRCRDELAAKLKIHASAFQFHHIERIPTTASGKVDYGALEPRP